MKTKSIIRNILFIIVMIVYKGVVQYPIQIILSTIRGTLNVLEGIELVISKELLKIAPKGEKERK